jgi:hypothetical protein
MNKHSAKLQSKNALRRGQNAFEISFIPEIINHVTQHIDSLVAKKLDQWEFPVIFQYDLRSAISLKMKKMGKCPYSLRPSKIKSIIDGLLEWDSETPIIDFSICDDWSIELEILRA